MEILINYDYREEDVAPLPLTELAEFVLQKEECPDGTEVSITFVDDDEIAALNSQYRGKEGPTDVLSFECDGVDDPDMPGMPEEFTDEDGEDVIFELGDVIIAVDVCERQTEEFGTTFEGEISLLLVHGLLHLCGYDHIEDDDAEEMEARERELLFAWAEHSGRDVAGQR